VPHPVNEKKDAYKQQIHGPQDEKEQEDVQTRRASCKASYDAMAIA